MTDIPDSREISPSTIEAMVQLHDESWEIQRAVPAERGFCSTYQLQIETGDGRREMYLKASPDGRTWGIPVEVRIQSVIAANTDVPVPRVHCVVDNHETLPSPFYLMSACPGEELPYEAVATMDDGTLSRLARETGEYLGAVHRLSGPDQFGQLGYTGRELVGDHPGTTPEILTADPAEQAWPAYLDEYAGHELDRHDDSAFSGITATIRDWVEQRISALEGPFRPVLGRNDHGLHNLLVDTTTGEITGLLDWNYTLAVPPAFDVEFAVYIYSGAFLAGQEAVTDRRPLVREAMLSGYRSATPDLAASVSSPTPLYQVLAMVRLMNDFDSLEYPDEEESPIKEYLRADVLSTIDADSPM
jgi:aminoglycoside phosphotransferase (APT) family kinase protein